MTAEGAIPKIMYREDAHARALHGRVEVPGALPAGCEYGIFMTARALADGVVRVIVDGEEALAINSDGTIQGNTIMGHAVVLCHDGPQGMIYVWMCPLCGQPLHEGQRCNSGVHEGPIEEAISAPPQAVRSIDLVEGLPHRGDAIERWLRRMRDKRPSNSVAYNTIGGLLSRWRECSDHGLSLQAADDERGDP